MRSARTAVCLLLALAVEACETQSVGFTGARPKVGSRSVYLTGGDGSSYERAIIVHAPDTRSGVYAMYSYMKARFGRFRYTDRRWAPDGDRSIDIFELTTPDGKKHVLYFDVTEGQEADGTWRKDASNQAMQRTAGRSALPLSMTSTFHLQPHSPSPAVADLVSR